MLFYYKITSVKCAEVAELALLYKVVNFLTLIPCDTSLYAVCTSRYKLVHSVLWSSKLTNFSVSIGVRKK